MPTINQVFKIQDIDRNTALKRERDLRSPIIRTSSQGGYAVTYGGKHYTVQDTNVYPSTLSRKEAEELSRKKNTPIFRESTSQPGKMVVTIGNMHSIVDASLVKPSVNQASVNQTSGLSDSAPPQQSPINANSDSKKKNISDVFKIAPPNRDSALKKSEELGGAPIIRKSSQGGYAVTYGDKHYLVKDTNVYPSTLSREDAEELSRKKNSPIFRESTSQPGKMVITFGKEHVIVDASLVKGSVNQATVNQAPVTQTRVNKTSELSDSRASPSQQTPINNANTDSKKKIVSDVFKISSLDRESALQKSNELGGAPIIRKSSEGGYAVTYKGEHFIVNNQNVYPSTLSPQEASLLSKQTNSPIFRESTREKGTMVVTIGNEHIRINSLVKESVNQKSVNQKSELSDSKGIESSTPQQSPTNRF